MALFPVPSVSFPPTVPRDRDRDFDHWSIPLAIVRELVFKYLLNEYSSVNHILIQLQLHITCIIIHYIYISHIYIYSRGFLYISTVVSYYSYVATSLSCFSHLSTILSIHWLYFNLYMSHSFILLFLTTLSITFMYNKLYLFKVVNSMSCTHPWFHQHNRYIKHSITAKGFSVPFFFWPWTKATTDLLFATTDEFTFYVNQIILYVFPCAWLLSLSKVIEIPSCGSF